MSISTRKIIRTENAPDPDGSYSQAVQINNLLYITGEIGVDPKAPPVAKLSSSAHEQTIQTLKNLGEILKAAGSDFDKVIKTTIILADVNDYQAVNACYSEVFCGDHPPARSTLQAGALPMGAKVKIDAIAIVGEVEDD